MAFTKVATVQEIPPGTCKQVFVSGKKVALVNVNGTFHALQDECSHRAASLSSGKISGSTLVCPWHGTRFDLKTGQNRNPPATRGVAVFKVQVVGDEVQVDIF